MKRASMVTHTLSSPKHLSQRWICSSLVLSCLFTGLTGLMGCSTIRPSVEHQHLGKDIKPMMVGSLSHGYLKVPHLKRLTLVDFWSTYCQPCKAQLPKLKTLYQTYHQRGLMIVGVAEDTNPLKVDQYIKKHNIPWPIIVDGQRRQLFGHFGVIDLPKLFLIDPAGKVIQIQGGATEAVTQIQETIISYLGSP